jgi:hypothetical protein
MKKQLERWAATARQGQIFAKRDKLYEMRRNERDPEMRRCVGFAIGLLDEELDIRRQLSKAHSLGHALRTSSRTTA